MRSGKSTCCGCRYYGQLRRHGHKTRDRGNGSPTLQSWTGMKSRCFYKKNIGYPHYGGRGITVCERWLGVDGFANFLADMGERPEGTSLDRIDIDRDYEPGNCRWATITEQNRNRSITKLTIADAREIRRRREMGEPFKSLAERFGISESNARAIVKGTIWCE